jgi:hypothetical protein
MARSRSRSGPLRRHSFHAYRLGTFTGSVTAVDLAGNQATQPFTVSVVPVPDVTPPTLAAIRFDPNVLTGRALRLVLGVSERANVTIAASVRALGRTYRVPVARRTLLTGRPTSVRLQSATERRSSECHSTASPTLL